MKTVLVPWYQAMAKSMIPLHLHNILGTDGDDVFNGSDTSVTLGGLKVLLLMVVLLMKCMEMVGMTLLL